MKKILKKCVAYILAAVMLLPLTVLAETSEVSVLDALEISAYTTVKGGDYELHLVISNDSGQNIDREISVQPILPEEFEIIGEESVKTVSEIVLSQDVSLSWPISCSLPSGFHVSASFDFKFLISIEGDETSESDEILIEKTLVITGRDVWPFLNEGEAFTHGYNPSGDSALMLWKNFFDNSSVAEQHRVANLQSSAWRGSCYGMAVGAVALNIDKTMLTGLDLENIGDLSPEQAHPFISYFHFTQKSDNVIANINASLKNPDKAKISSVDSYFQAPGEDTPLLIFDFQWSGTYNADHATFAVGDRADNSHAIVLFGEIESGDWSFNDKAYTNRIKAYDANLSDAVFLYYSDDKESWTVPEWTSREYITYDKISIKQIIKSSDIKLIDPYAPKEANPLVEGDILDNLLEIRGIDSFKLSTTSENSVAVNGLSTTGNITAYPFFDANADGPPNLNVFIPQADTYIISDTSANADISLTRDDTWTHVFYEDAESLAFDGTDIAIKSNKGGYSIVTTQIKDYSLFIIAGTTNGDISGDISIENAADGVIISGDLSDVNLSVRRTDKFDTLNLSTTANQVMVKDTAEGLAAFTASEDGEFDVPVSEVDTEPQEITISPLTDKNFGTVPLGYSQIAEHIVTITNNTDAESSGIEISLTGENADSFILSKSEISSIAAGTSDSFSVMPKAELAVGSYSAVVTITGEFGSKSFDLSFTVRAEKISTPQISTNSNSATFTDSLVVSLFCQTDGANIYYTTNGSDPVLNGKLYTDEFRITQTTTIKAYAVKEGFEDSDVASATFRKIVSGSSGAYSRSLPGGHPLSNAAAATSSSKATEGVFVNGKTMTADVDSDGILNLNYSESDIRGIGNSNGRLDIEVRGHDDIRLTLPVAALGGDDLAVITDFGTIGIPDSTLKRLGANLHMLINRGSFVFALKDENSNNRSYNEPNSPFTLTLPYVSESWQDTNAVVVIGDDGNIIPFAIRRNGSITFHTATTGKYEAVYNKKSFPDTPGHWAVSHIDFVAARGLYSGNEIGHFLPENAMTRAMFCQVLANLEGAALQRYNSSRFSDVNIGAWYLPAVEWAADNGIVSGVGNGRFSPDSDITREQMAVMLDNYVNYRDLSLPAAFTPVAFADRNEISSWAVDSIDRIQASGIVSGKPGNLYDPKAKATRAETAVIFSRLINMVAP